MADAPFHVGQVLTGPLLNQPMGLETVASNDDAAWVLGVVRTRSERFRRVAEDRRDCYWLYAVTNCNAEPKLRTIKDPASYDWQPVQKVQHYRLPSGTLTGYARGSDDPPDYGNM